MTRKEIMCHNSGAWYNCSQVKLTSEKSCQRPNCKTKHKLESKNSVGNNRDTLGNKCDSVTREQVSLGNNRASLGNNPVSLTWEKSCQCHLETNVLVSLGNNRASVNRE